MGDLATTPVYRVPKIVVASSRVVLGQSPGGAIAPLLPGYTSVVDDFFDVINRAQTGPSTMMGLEKFPTTLSTPWLPSDRLRVGLLGQ